MKHGLHKTAEYRIWAGVIQRCENPKDTAYSNYGGRGITVCKEWRDDFLVFLKDMGKRPSKEHSIERTDNNKGYNPDNCKWVTREEQANNTRRNVFYDYQGEQLTLPQIARLTGISNKSLWKRVVERGWGLQKAIDTPIKTKQELTYVYSGIEMNLKEVADAAEVDYKRLHDRVVNQGMELVDAINKSSPIRHILEYQGRLLTITELAKETNMNPSTIHTRIFSDGLTAEEAVARPVGKRRARVDYPYQGRMLTAREISNITKVDYVKLRNYLVRGATVEEALAKC